MKEHEKIKKAIASFQIAINRMKEAETIVIGTTTRLWIQCEIERAKKQIVDLHTLSDWLSQPVPEHIKQRGRETLFLTDTYLAEHRNGGRLPRLHKQASDRG